MEAGSLGRCHHKCWEERHCHHCHSLYRACSILTLGIITLGIILPWLPIRKQGRETKGWSKVTPWRRSGCGSLTPHAVQTVLRKSPDSRGQFLRLPRTLCDSAPIATLRRWGLTLGCRPLSSLRSLPAPPVPPVHSGHVSLLARTALCLRDELC